MKPLDRAWTRACANYKSPGFRSVYMAGARAAQDGRPIESCPYRRSTRKSWRPVYRAAWLNGYRSMTL